MSVTLYKGDCFEQLKNVADKSVDFVLTDPPYEFKEGGFGGGSRELSDRKFKHEIKNNPLLFVKFDAEKLMKEIERVCKKVNAVVFGTDVMMYKLMDYCVKQDYYYNLTYWYKTNPPPFVNNNYLKDVECALAIREKGCEMFGDYRTLSKVYTSQINKQDKDLYKHPTVKPVPLLEKYITNHSKEGDTVLDMYMGSGSTGVACHNLNRNYIGIEIDDTYFNTAKARLDSYKMALF